MEITRLVATEVVRRSLGRPVVAICGGAVVRSERGAPTAVERAAEKEVVDQTWITVNVQAPQLILLEVTIPSDRRKHI